jgi:hypothetical protein
MEHCSSVFRKQRTSKADADNLPRIVLPKTFAELIAASDGVNDTQNPLILTAGRFLQTLSDNGYPIQINPKYVANVNRSFVRAYLAAEGIKKGEIKKFIKNINDKVLQDPEVSITSRKHCILLVSKLGRRRIANRKRSTEAVETIYTDQSPRPLPPLPTPPSKGVVDNALGEIKEIAMISKYLSVETSFGAIAAMPKKRFTLLYNNESWAEKGIKDFPAFVRSNLAAKGVLTPSIVFRREPIADSASEWLRDVFFQGRDQNGARYAVASEDSSGLLAGFSLLDAKIPMVDLNIDVNGGAFRAAGDTVFVSKDQMNQAVDYASRFWREVRVSLPLGIRSFTLVLGPSITSDAIVSHLRLNDPLAFQMVVREARAKVPDQERYLSFSRTQEEGDAILASAYLYDYIRIPNPNDPFAENGIETLRQIIVVGSKIFPLTTDVAVLREAVKKEYATVFNRKIVVVGEDVSDDELPQNALAHIDLYVNFLVQGKKADGSSLIHAVVPSLEMASSILSKLSPNEREEVEQEITYQGREDTRALRPLPATASDARFSGLFLDMQNTLERYSVNFKKNPDLVNLSTQLDTIARWLEKQGYPVSRIPALFDYYGGVGSWMVWPVKGSETPNPLSDTTELAFVGDYGGARRTFSPVNALVETARDQKGRDNGVVYMPTLGIRVFEKEIVKIYNDLGYRVVPVRGYIDASASGSLLDCYTNEFR